MSRMIAVLRTDLIWFLLGDLVGDPYGIFENPDDPDRYLLLHQKIQAEAPAKLERWLLQDTGIVVPLRAGGAA